VPTLVIGTGRDLAHPLDMAKALAAQIPKAELVEITPKSDNRKAYVREFRDAVGWFLREVL
jgi:pimeloyl-ACP methyl ester carboxylesterase